MSRSRAYGGDPFWATSLSKMKPGPANIVRGLWELIKRSPALALLLWMGSGWRTGSAEHSSGRAIDIIITSNTGKRPTAKEHAAAMALIRWLQANATALGIQHILFSTDGKNRTQSWNSSRRTWVNLAPRGGISADHIDHIHIYFKTSANWLTRFNSVIIGTGPGLPGSGVDNSTKPSTPSDKDDIMATKDELREILNEVLPGAVRAGVLSYMEDAKRYSEYGDEHGDGRNTRSPIDIAFSGQNHALGANQNTLTLLNRVTSLDARLTALTQAVGQAVKDEGVDIPGIAKAVEEVVERGNSELKQGLSFQLDQHQEALRLAVAEALQETSTVDPDTFAQEVYEGFRKIINKLGE